MHKLGSSVQKKNGYITISEGTNQITIILDSKFRSLSRSAISQRPRYAHDHIAAVGVTFSEEYLKVPGFMAVILQQMMLLNINIIEVSSTFTELVLYIEEKDLKLTFDALHGLFAIG